MSKTQFMSLNFTKYDDFVRVLTKNVLFWFKNLKTTNYFIIE